MPKKEELVMPSDFEDAPEGWEPAYPFRGLAVEDSFLSGKKNPKLIAINYFRRISDGVLVAKVWFGPQAEGPPGHAHGGTMAAVMDEGMGAGAWYAGYPVVAAKITVNFSNKLPLGTVATLEASVVKVDGRKIYTKARLTGPQGLVFCEGEGLFIVIPKASVQG